MRLLVILLVTAAMWPAPALAQHDGHAGHGTQVSQPAENAPARPANSADAHHEHKSPRPDPIANESEADGDPHAGHVMPAPMAGDAHAAHGPINTPVPPLGGPPAQALSGPENAADIYFGDAAMEQARRELGRMHGNMPAYRVLIDRLEAQVSDRTDRYLFDAQAWYGGDIDKLWLKAEGGGAFGGEFGGAEVQALWSHAIGPWFDLQAGVRYDMHSGEDRGHLVLGVQGLAPYWIEIEAAGFVSDRGDLTARVEAEHDARITQKLILQPRAELHFSLQDVPEDLTGSGLSSAAFGARLRYQVTPLLGPYIGIEYERAFGDTRKLRSSAGRDLGRVRYLAGIRAWF